MSHTLSAAYKGLSALLIESDQLVSPAELQGIIMGRAAAGADLSKSCLADLEFFLVQGQLSEALSNAILGLQAMVEQELNSKTKTVTLLLPSDDEHLFERLKALVSWCQGFLSGFGLVQQENPVIKTCLGVLEDVLFITQMDTTVEPKDEARSEADYIRIVEYLRILPISLFSKVMEKQMEQKSELPPSTLH